MTQLSSQNSIKKNRVLCLALALFSLFSVLIMQFYKIQITEGEYWTKQAEKQHYFVIKEPFIRGTFYSNTDIKQWTSEVPQKFVVDIEKFHLFVDPESIPEEFKAEISKALLKILSIPQSENKLFFDNFLKKTRSRRVAMWLNKETQNQILAWWQPYARQHRIPRNSLYFVSDYQRSYPFGKLLGQVLQTVQNIKDEKTQQAIPTGGLELYFNKYLKGRQGKRRLMRSPRNSFEIGDIISQPENGADIYLTINHYLQAIAEEEIAKGVKNFKAKSGWVVMMQPHTGEILALAQYPFFDPSDYQRFYTDAKLIDDVRVKAVLDAHEPGSVMKALTIALALKANKVLKKKGEKTIFSPRDKIATSNSHFLGRKNLKDTHLHYFLNMDMAVQRSSNIYVARLIEKVIDRLGKDWYKKELHQTFGFGEKTQIELPGESYGMVPTPGKKHPNGTLEWSVPTPYSLAMGHNIQITSLQLARAYAVFANGGYLVKPTLVKKIVKTEGVGPPYILVDNTCEERRKQFPRVLDSDIVQQIASAMKYTTKPGGTARKADIWGYTEAGKTGTAQKIVHGEYSDTLYCSSFVGITPVNKAAFVLVVTLDEPEYRYIPGLGKNHHGGTCAAPVFREIAKRSLEYLGIAPDDPHGYPTGDPRYDADKADWMPEIRALQEIYEKWNNVGESKTLDLEQNSPPQTAARAA
jgi:cell division protein FtsI (penicillin-binding protein 3)